MLLIYIHMDWQAGTGVGVRAGVRAEARAEGGREGELSTTGLSHWLLFASSVGLRW